MTKWVRWPIVALLLLLPLSLTGCPTTPDNEADRNRQPHSEGDGHSH